MFEIAIAGFTLLASGLGALALFNISTQQKRTDAVFAGLSRLQQDFADFRERVAERYATIGSMGELERKMFERFDRIDQKLDRMQGTSSD